MKMKMKFVLCIVIGLAVTKVVKGTESAVRDGCSVNKSGIPLCSQLCLESAEQYTCSCMTGYVLADDNKTCFISGEEPRLVYVSGKEVSVYFTETGDIEPLTELPNSHVTDLGFGPDDSVLVVSDNGTVVYRTSLDDGNTRGEPVPLVDTGLKSVTSVAVDWITHNIYLVDNEAGTIIVCTWKADNCSVLIRDLQRPHSVVLNIRSRKLLWTEWGTKDQTGSIKTADLDGSQHSLILDSLNGPRNLFLDTTVEKLYWVATTQSGYIIQSLKLNSEHRKVSVISNGITFPSVSGVSVLSDQLYVTGSNGTVVINKFTGQLLGNESLDTGSITAAAVYHRVLYDTQDIVDPCGSSPCCHLCVPSNSNHGYRCLCPVDMELDTDGKCTRRKDVERLLVSGMTGIYDIPKEFIGNHDYRGQRLLNAEVNCVVYDSIEETVFYYDDSARAIQMIWLENPQKPSLLYKPMSAVEGMAHDPSSHNIYWTTTKISGYITKAKKGDYDQVFHIEANLDERTVSLTTNNTITRYAVREALRVVVKYARWSNLSAVRRSLNFDDMEGNVDVEIPSNQLGDLLPLDYAMQSLYTAGFPTDSRTPAAEDLFSLVWSPDNDAEISDIRPVSVEILPQDILIKILTEYLSLKDALSVCQTSRRLSVLRRTPQFWARKLLIDHKCRFTFREGSNRDYELLEDTYKAMNDFEL